MFTCTIPVQYTVLMYCTVYVRSPLISILKQIKIISIYIFIYLIYDITV